MIYSLVPCPLLKSHYLNLLVLLSYTMLLSPKPTSFQPVAGYCSFTYLSFKVCLSCLRPLCSHWNMTCRARWWRKLQGLTLWNMQCSGWVCGMGEVGLFCLDSGDLFAVILHCFCGPPPLNGLEVFSERFRHNSIFETYFPCFLNTELSCRDKGAQPWNYPILRKSLKFSQCLKFVAGSGLNWCIL